MRTEKDAVDMSADMGEFVAEFPMHGIQCIDRKESSADPRLIADNGDADSRMIQAGYCL